MNDNDQKIKYLTWCRKSSESEDRQVQSLDDQSETLSRLAKDRGVKSIDEYKVARSAKQPENRPDFNEMIDRLERGEANGIMCWKLNRLSRNPYDSGRIQWLLQNGVIKSILTPHREYLPDDNALIFSIESGTANQFIIDLKKDTKRGLKRKLKAGWRPGVAPQGYLNVKKFSGEQQKDVGTIVIDPDRFELVRKMWDLMLTGTYTVPQILDKANNKWGYKTRKTRRLGGKPLGQSSLYRIFTNDFYTGTFTYNNEEWEGKHKPMVTVEEFDRVQKILGRK